MCSIFQGLSFDICLGGVRGREVKNYPYNPNPNPNPNPKLPL